MPTIRNQEYGRNGRRSAEWLDRRDLDGFLHRSWLKSEGFSDESFRGRPLIGICNSWSELVNCNVHLRGLAESVKRGVLQAGGFPLEFPVISLGESLMKPTTMLYRNLMAMDVEESIRAYPLDGVVLLTGCDKTNPASVMGMASADVPAIVVTGGPMLNGKWRGEDLGSCSDCWHYHEELRAGRIDERQFAEIEARHVALARPLHDDGDRVDDGLRDGRPGSLPARDSGHSRCRFAPEGNSGGVRPQDRGAGRARNPALRPDDPGRVRERDPRSACDLGLDERDPAPDRLCGAARHRPAAWPVRRVVRSDTPWLVDVKPSGRHLMEDFFYAGGLPAVMNEIRDLLHLDALTVSGTTVDENLAGAEIIDPAVIARREQPLGEGGALKVLYGSLCPDGAVIKVSAADPKLLRHEGRAIVFEDVHDLAARVDDPDLDIDSDCVMVLRNAGPVGAPGMPEWGHLPIPAKLLRAGVTDIVRISDARMSGTSYGAVVLHVAPESAVGGPLAIVQEGDRIRLDVEERVLDLLIDEEELARRREAWEPPARKDDRGYRRLYEDHVLQANHGCDFDFLRGRSPVVSDALTYL